MMHAKSQKKHFILQHFSANEGFFAKQAFSVVSTKNDMLWICSDEGLVKYDGKNFVHFKHDINDSTSIISNYCKMAVVDKRGWLWIISDDDLEIFNPLTEKFKHAKIKNELNKEISVLPNILLYDSTKDVLWIGTRKGLLKSQNGSINLEKVSSTFNNLNTNIATICFEDPNTLWLTSDYKIIKYNTASKATEFFEIPISINGVKNFNNSTQALCSFYEVKKNTLWLGMWVMGIIEFNTKTKIFNQYFFDKNYHSINNSIGSIIYTTGVGMEDILWVSTDEHGLGAFNKIDKKFTCYTANNYTDVTGIKGTTFGLYHHKNRIWIGSSSGLHCLDFNQQLIGQLSLNSLNISLQGLAVSNMEVEKNERNQDEKLWIYLPYRNAYVFDILKNTVKNVPDKIRKYLVPKTNFWEWYIDSKNVLWISTGQYGLIGYNINTDKIIIEEKKYFNKNWEWAISFFEDSKNNIWIGTFKGLFKLNAAKTNIEAIETVNHFLETNNFPKAIVDITEDENKNIWFIADGSDEKKSLVLKLNPSNNQLNKCFDERKIANDYSPALELKTICSDKKGKVLLSIQNQGLVYFKTNDTGLQKMTNLNDSYTSSYRLLKTNEIGKVWFQSNLGFACYNSSQNIIINNNYSNFGLEYNNFPGSYYSNQSNNYYIGQLDNVSYLNTKKLFALTEQSNFLFISFKVSNKPFLLASQIENDKTVYLEHNQNMLSISFALLNYTNSFQNTYRWKLEGLENNWNTSTSNEAVYNNLLAGKYKLIVKAANSAGIWNDKPIILNIVISPPFYKTWWFALLCLLCLGFIGYLLIQQRINNIKAKYSLRNKIASDLHDEIGSTLTSINILSNVSQQTIDIQPKYAIQMLEQISQQSKNIQQNMSDIVWSIRPDNERIENLITRMTEYSAQTLEPLNISFKIDTDDTLINKILPMEYRKDVLLIFKEAINNIAKHANATFVNVKLNDGGKKLTLCITDNGTWKGNTSGTGTKSMKERAASLGGSVQINTINGTSIILTIPLP